ncbi:MAG: hypothetical protein C0466_16735 [Candidatus Accumulibacter sp.]|nr:hypothetical protein [Accumulibacter sp.]
MPNLDRPPGSALAILAALAAFFALAAAPARAADDAPEHEDWTARFQSTYIMQKKPGFAARYSGANRAIR